MDVLQDWKLYAFVINGFLTIGGFLLIKFNDFRHLEEDVNEIKEDLKTNTSKVIKIDKRLAVQKQRIDDLEKSTK